MAQILADTLQPGKLVREPPAAIARLLEQELSDGEPIVSLLETASEYPLRGGGARIWVALTDRRVWVLAALDVEDSFAEEASAQAVSHRAKLGRDEITVANLTLKCPFLRGGSEFKVFAKLAAADAPERLRQAAEHRLKDGQELAAAAIAQAGLAARADTTLLALRVQALVALESYEELSSALSALVEADPELLSWERLEGPMRSAPKALWMLYEAADEEGVASLLRERLRDLRDTSPREPLLAELAIRMDADEEAGEEGLTRAVAWLEEDAVTSDTFLRLCTILARSGLDTEALHRQRAKALADTGRLDDALDSVARALEKSRSPSSLRVRADVLLRAGRTAEASEPLEELLGLGEDDWWVRSKLGSSFEAQGRLRDAVIAREGSLELLATDPELAEATTKERRALARLHRAIATKPDESEHDLRLAYAELLEEGDDWAARLGPVPPMVLAGAKLDIELDLLVARRLVVGEVEAGLVFEESVKEARKEAELHGHAPEPLQGGIVGHWPPEHAEDDVVHSGKRGARVRYPVGEATSLEVQDVLERGRHRLRATLDVPADIRPSYRGNKVMASLVVWIAPLGARFPVFACPCHAPGEPGQREHREAAGKVALSVDVENARWSFGGVGRASVSASLGPHRPPDRIEAALVATERMRPPHKGEQEVTAHTWSFPVFDYELEDGRVERLLQLGLPKRGTATGMWTWFELVWVLRVRLLRKDKPEASVEVPILLKCSAPATESRRDGEPASPLAERRTISAPPPAGAASTPPPAPPKAASAVPPAASSPSPPAERKTASVPPPRPQPPQRKTASAAPATASASPPPPAERKTASVPPPLPPGAAVASRPATPPPPARPPEDDAE